MCFCGVSKIYKSYNSTNWLDLIRSHKISLYESHNGEMCTITAAKGIAKMEALIKTVIIQTHLEAEITQNYTITENTTSILCMSNV